MNVLYDTPFRNYPSVRLLFPSILSIPLRAEQSRRDQANRQLRLGLVWRNRKKISQIIKDYFNLPFFLLIIWCCAVYTSTLWFTHTHTHVTRGIPMVSVHMCEEWRSPDSTNYDVTHRWWLVAVGLCEMRVNWFLPRNDISGLCV
jgi:hypothetical protein